MATHDYVLANASGAAFRADLNNALAAIVSNNSNATAPATTYAYQWWADTNTGQLKLRNSANDAWIVIRELDGTMLMEDGTAAAPGLAFASDLDTGFLRPGANSIAISTAGNQRLVVDASGQVAISESVVASGDIQSTSQNGSQLAGFRNILINGNLTINQRGVDIAAAATGSYGQDRWKKTAAGMTQVIEAGNFEPGATYTLSGTAVTTVNLTAPGSGNWTLPEISVAARKVQLEPGSVATPFEHRPIGLELALCQRYFQRVGGSAMPIATGFIASATASALHISYKTTMRAAPSVSSSGTTSDFVLYGDGLLRTVTGIPSGVLMSPTDAQIQVTGTVFPAVGTTAFLRTEAAGFVNFDAEL
jgi:hypothetical protein